MTRKEKIKYLVWANSLTDEQLEDEYYKFVSCSLGSQVEEMYERGYDIRDIHEQEKMEHDYQIIAHILERVCYSRGIRLWQ